MTTALDPRFRPPKDDDTFFVLLFLVIILSWSCILYTLVNQ